MDEQLTLQVKTLGSTKSGLVYENYAHFLDATDAVKSVGVNVQANEQGLQRLQQGMETINDMSRLVEEDLGSLRDAVAEKIRVRRLLTRLDALLKLPETLRRQIAAGKYRTAASSFLRSTTILSKHSAGFESLQKIETSCNAIVVETTKDLNRKILHWSGQSTALGMVGSASDDEDNSSEAHSSEDYELPPDPPASISEIFVRYGLFGLLLTPSTSNLSHIFSPLNVFSTKGMRWYAGNVRQRKGGCWDGRGKLHDHVAGSVSQISRSSVRYPSIGDARGGPQRCD